MAESIGHLATFDNGPNEALLREVRTPLPGAANARGKTAKATRIERMIVKVVDERKPVLRVLFK